MPEEAASDFESYIAQQLSEKDVAKEHIMAKLATRVEVRGCCDHAGRHTMQVMPRRQAGGARSRRRRALGQ